MLETQNISTPPAVLLREDGKKRHQILHVFNITVFVFFFFQIDHKSTFKNSKPAFLLLVPLLSFDFFFNTFLSLCLCMAFFPFYTGKIRRQYYSALKSLCYYRFFSLKSNIGRYILQWWAYLNKSKQFLSSAEPKITTFSPLNCQKTCYHQNESSCLQSRKRLLNLIRTGLLLNYLEKTMLKFSLFRFIYLMQTEPWRISP